MLIMGYRLLYLDYARLLGALFVIYVHLFPADPNDFVRVSFCHFCMPLFFFISGVLHKYKETVQVKKYVRTILVPAFFFSLLFYFFIGPILYYGYQPNVDSVDLFLAKETLGETYVALWSHGWFIFSRYSSLIDVPCWFLVSLFYCRVLTDLMEKYKYFRFIVALPVLIVLFVGTGLHFCLESAAMALPFYYGGYCFRHHFHKFVEMKCSPVWYVFGIVIFFSIIYFNGHISMWGVYFGNLWRPLSVLLFYLNGMIGTCLVIKFSSLFIKESFYSKMSYSLITILGMQLFFIAIYNIVFPERLGHIEAIVPAIIILFLCHFCHKLFEKYVPFAVGKWK